MKKAIILFIVVIVVIFVGYQLLKPKKSASALNPSQFRQRTSTTSTGKTAGQIKTKTKEEIAEEKRQAKLAERKRRQELLRKKREERRAQQLALRYSKRRYGDYLSRTKRGRRASYSTSSRQKRTTGLYQVTAIFKIEGKNYALIDGRYVTIGDDIMGRKVTDILDDRIIINEYGRSREVKVGESVLPTTVTQPRRTR